MFPEDGDLTEVVVEKSGWEMEKIIFASNLIKNEKSNKKQHNYFIKFFRNAKQREKNAVVRRDAIASEKSNAEELLKARLAESLRERRGGTE
ncbi:hypothetical protein EVAR_72709_1 [Eumeta japonica]|uniref:Uncharacterized protein n=1 Tax=Eumeta variegata TaxID=151549 RepID=A0A4C1SFP3_EUMVA|nr:hypothetical protein EVAR_72709_1 [Eumeta japonica]